MTTILNFVTAGAEGELKRSPKVLILLRIPNQEMMQVYKDLDAAGQIKSSK